MDSLELKVPKEELESHLKSIRHFSAMDKEENPIRKSKINKAPKQQSRQVLKSYKLLRAETKSGVKTKINAQDLGIRGVNTHQTKHITVLRIPMHG